MVSTQQTWLFNKWVIYTDASILSPKMFVPSPTVIKKHFLKYLSPKIIVIKRENIVVK